MADHVDVLIVGAGISGIGAAAHLKQHRPGDTVAILDGRNAIGGTWNLFRYPGIRSDSDMPTFGYGFKPWTHQHAIADGHVIVDYLQRTIDEYGIGDHIRFGHKVLSADFSRRTGLWTLAVQVEGSTQPQEFTSRFLYLGTGYYDYESGYTPELPGIEEFAGTVVHPQKWPEDLDFADKRVVVIGSGATAVTLVPAMAPTAGHVTMLQRSPSYVLSLPQADPIANLLHRLLSPELAHRIVRRKNVAISRGIFKACMRAPRLMRRLLIAGVRRRLPKTFDVDTHFAPRYNPWEQRLCMVPDGDLFKAISSGRASVVTDRIARFTPTGIALESGQELKADIVITATGLNMLAGGRIRLSVDVEPRDLADTVAFRSMMLSGVPNAVVVIGYSNASWTLKADLVAEHFCRILDHMEKQGVDVYEPVLSDPTMERLPLLELTSGYVQRGIAQFPHAGAEGPWTAEHAYEQDVARLRDGPVTDPALQFSRVEAPSLVG